VTASNGFGFVRWRQSFGDHPNLDSKIPPGSQILATWYVPIDNIPDVAGFSHIEVTIDDENTITLRLSAVTGREALLRILIHAVYGPK
jgi:hypothetical protein